MKKFWMVKGAGPTSHQHPTKESAVKEAERLANQHPNCPFYVMEAMSYSRSIRTVEQGDCTEEEPVPTGGWRKVRDWRDIGKTAFNSSRHPGDIVPEDRCDRNGYIPCDRNYRLRGMDGDEVLVGTDTPWNRWPKEDTWVWDPELDVPF